MGRQDLKQDFDHDIRCRCGQLIARWTSNGLEIKCKRCRRIVHIPFQSISGSSPRIPSAPTVG